MIDLFIFLLA